MAQRPLHVTVYYEIHPPQAGACCGASPSSGELAEHVVEHLNQRYGDNVELEFLDLSDAQVRLRNHELAKRIGEGEALLPLITVEGVPRLWGAADFWSIVKAIDTHREVIGG